VCVRVHVYMYVCKCVSATGTGQCLITANIQGVAGVAAASLNWLVALFTHWRIY